MAQAVAISGIDLVTSAALRPVPHGFLGRAGGVSEGIYASLNVGLGSGDVPESVRENRRRALALLPGADALVTVRQVHGSRALAVGWPFDDSARPEADAMATDRPGLALGILTADCAPVLLADAAAGVIGAAHAGWKGALGGVIASVVAAMEELGAERARIAAAVGPTIAQASYEVDAAFRERFLADDPAHDAWFAAGRAGHVHFDLEGFVGERLRGAGVGRVDRLGLDTYAHEQRFFSYRRATHRGEPDYGRQLSAICLPR